MIRLFGNRLQGSSLRVVVEKNRSTCGELVCWERGKKGKKKKKRREKETKMAPSIFLPAYILKYGQGDEMINGSSILARKKTGKKRRIDETFEKDTFK